MKLHRTLIAGGFAVVTAVSALTAAMPVFSQPSPNNSSAVTSDAGRQDKIRAHVQARLERMAKRLNIDASQQDAWNRYAQTVQGMIGTGLQRPAKDADAATVVRFRAQAAEDHARKLAQLADATATLQQALNPDQRKILDDLVRHGDHRRFDHRETNRG